MVFDFRLFDRAPKISIFTLLSIHKYRLPLNRSTTMKFLFSECYAISLKLTRVKFVAYWVALGYISLLMCNAIGGLLALASGWLGFAGMLLPFFKFPRFVAPLALLFLVIYKLSPNMSQAVKEAKKHSGFTNALVFTLFSIILFIYMKYGDAIFPSSELVGH